MAEDAGSPQWAANPRTWDLKTVSSSFNACSIGGNEPDPVLRFLRQAVCQPFAPVITRKPGQDWRSLDRPWRLDPIARAVRDPDQIVGIRPEGRLRLTWVDIDRHGDNPSPYWHPDGQSPELRALDREATAAGCGVVLLRSSASGGLHVVVLLPEPVPAWRTHWVVAELVARAGMTPAAGVCELFPSRLDYRDSPNPTDWAQSHGVRLPGQEGGALLLDSRAATDCDLIYEELLSQLESTATGPAWDELLQAADARQKTHRRTCRSTPRPRLAHTPIRRCSQVVRWTGPGQSNDNLRQITTQARLTHPKACTVDALAPIIEAMACGAPGFKEHASEATQQRLAAWARDWARSSLRRGWLHRTPARKTGDRRRNARLLQRSWTRLGQVCREAGEAASRWSQQKVARVVSRHRKLDQRRHQK